MRFLPGLREFLSEREIIYTVRGYDMKTAVVTVEGVGRCKRTSLGRVYTHEELSPYVHLSGFEGLKDWCDKINEFIIPGQDRWLYKVEVL